MNLIASTFICLATLHTASAARLSKTDRTFMSTLARAGIAEIEAGQVAAMRGDRFNRSFGKQMVREHQAAAAQLAKLAQNRRFALPDSAAAPDEAQIQRLEQMQGSKFNKAYHRFAVASHQQAVALFHDEIAHGSDPGLKSWARRTLPTIQKHLMEAKSRMMR